MRDYPHIICTGNPVDGFTYYGPFPSREAATEAAERTTWEGEWWIIRLNQFE